MNNDDPILYILMRTDLDSMNSGKGMSQAAHAANKFSASMFDASTEFDNASFSGKKFIYWLFEQWEEQASRFGTTIVLDGVDELTIDDVMGDIQQSMNDGLIQENLIDCSLVYDPTYPIRIPNEEISFMIPRDEDTAQRVYNPKDRSVTIFRNVLTCAYIFGRKCDIEDFVSHLNLHS